MDYLVVYTSNTGNTEKVAMKIFDSLPGRSKDIQRLEELRDEEADTYFVGFWNDRGTCGSREYFKQVENRVSVFVPEDNEYLGCFLCGGKMMPQVLDRYKQMQAINDSPQIRTMIAAYEEGMLHPDEQDFRDAEAFVEEVLNK